MNCSFPIYQPAPCNMNIPVWVVFSTTPILAKGYLAYHRCKILGGHVANRGDGTRIFCNLNTIATASVLSVVLFILILITPFAFPQATSFLTGLAAATYFTSLDSMFLKLLRVGTRIIPKEIRNKHTSGMSDQYSVKDEFLIFLSLISRSCMVVVVGLSITSVILPSQLFYQYILGMTMLGFVLGTAQIIYQYQRCKNTIKEIMQLVRGTMVASSDPSNSTSQGGLGLFRKAVREMTNLQLVLSAVTAPFVITSLLFCFGIIPIGYWTFPIQTNLDVINDTMMYLVSVKDKKDKKVSEPASNKRTIESVTIRGSRRELAAQDSGQ